MSQLPLQHSGPRSRVAGAGGGDEQHTGVAHILKVWAGTHSADPKTDVAVQNSDGSEPRPASDRARSTRRDRAGSRTAWQSGNFLAELASEIDQGQLVRLTVYPSGRKTLKTAGLD